MADGDGESMAPPAMTRSTPSDCSKRARIDLLMPAFPATRHSIVQAMRSVRADDRRAAFDALVTAYWKPVFKYVRLKWRASPEDAADVTQAFFLRAFEKDFFAGFDPGEGAVPHLLCAPVSMASSPTRASPTRASSEAARSR